jgi:thiamine transport system permease protein
VAPRRFVSVDPIEVLGNAAAILLTALFVAGPLAAIVVSGLSADLSRIAGETSVQRACLTSLAFAAMSGLTAVALSLALVAMRQGLQRERRGSRRSLLEHAADSGAGFVLVVPPIVVGAGWFILVRRFGDVFLLAPFMVVSVNAVMAMPFVVRAIRPAYDTAAERHDRLAASLGISGWDRLRLIDWPSSRRSLLTGLAFAMALSLGDLGVIALFGSDAVKTLPLLLLERMGSYRTADAAGLALIVAALCLGLMAAADRLAKGPHR